MKRYLHSNDPLFDPVTLGYLLHRGAIRDRNKQLRWQGIKSLVQQIAERNRIKQRVIRVEVTFHLLPKMLGS